MRYIPHAFTFMSFALLGFCVAGLLSPLILLRGIGALFCLFVCVLVVDAAFVKRRIRPAETRPRYMTAIAQTTLKKGDICTVDTSDRTVEKAVS